MKNTLLLFSCAFLMLSFLACEKGDFDKTAFDKDYDKTKEDYDKAEWDKKDCFELVYPVTFTLPDGSTTTGDEGVVWDAIKDWYSQHPDSKASFELNYPVDVAFTDGYTKTIADEDHMVKLKKYCDGGDKKACFDLVYPITFILPDGSTVSGEKDVVWDQMKSWFENHPDASEKYEMQYPVNIITKDGSTKEIADEKAMILAKKACWKKKKKQDVKKGGE